MYIGSSTQRFRAGTHPNVTCNREKDDFSRSLGSFIYLYFLGIRYA